jgi:mono/diheme cytochrome c family protein
MRHPAFLFLLCILAAPLAVHAQQASSSDSVNSLNDTQKEGRLLFQQRCPICHSAVMITRRPYAPVLFKGRVMGNEDRIRETIENGRPGKMPAFKYGMTTEEINSIVEYLKTVTTPFEMHPKGQADAAATPAANANSNASE